MAIGVAGQLIVQTFVLVNKLNYANGKLGKRLQTADVFI